MKQVTRDGMVFEGQGREWYLVTGGTRSKVYNTYLLKKLRQASRTSKPHSRKRSNFRWVMAEMQRRYQQQMNKGQDWILITKGQLAGLERNLSWDLYRTPQVYQALAGDDVVPASKPRYLTGQIVRRIGWKATKEFMWRREEIPDYMAHETEQVLRQVPAAVITGKSWWKTLRWMAYRAFNWIRRA